MKLRDVIDWSSVILIGSVLIFLGLLVACVYEAKRQSSLHPDHSVRFVTVEGHRFAILNGVAICEVTSQSLTNAQ